MSHSSIHNHNRDVWDAMAKTGARFARPATADDLSKSLIIKNGGSKWLGGSIRGKRVLCLASGGGRQSVMYAEAGAIVTVVDISPRMLELDRQVAQQRKLSITAIEASMDDLRELPAASFDIVIQPVSTCYVPDVALVYRNVARVIRVGGLYISQHKQPTSLQMDVGPSKNGYELVEPYYRKQGMAGALPPVSGSLHRESGTLEFLHTWAALIGGLCRSGFVVEDLTEPNHTKFGARKGSFEERSRYAPPYVLIKARRVPVDESVTAEHTTHELWTP